MDRYIFDFQNRPKFENNGKLSSVDLIMLYINDPNSFDLDNFCLRYRIPKNMFTAKTSSAKIYHKELYESFIKAREENKLKYRKMLEDLVEQILTGIKTGLTVDQREFNVYEFYKLLPFIGKDFSSEMRCLSKDFDDLDFQTSRQIYCLSQHRCSTSPCTYADNFMIFVMTICKDPTDVEIIKQYMIDNGINKINPIHRVSIINACNEYNTEITREECEEIFAYMDQMGYPCILEVYYRLKEEKINSRKRK